MSPFPDCSHPTGSSFFKLSLTFIIMREISISQLLYNLAYINQRPETGSDHSLYGLPYLQSYHMWGHNSYLILIKQPPRAPTMFAQSFQKSPTHHPLTGHPPSCSCKYLLTPPVISLVPWAKPSWPRDGHPAWATVYDPRSVLARAHSSSVDPQLSYSKHDSSQHSNTVNLSPLTVEDQVSSVNITTVVRVSECPRVS